MMRVFSPHLDDAVLSLGTFLASVPCEVVTVFAGTPTNIECSPYDAARGFTSTAESMQARRSEDTAALEVLRCRPVHLDFLDGQYGPTRDDAELDAIVSAIRARMSPGTHTLAPLGIGHPDHVWLAFAARAAVEHGELLLYEELPYRVVYPEAVWAQLDLVRREGFTVDPLTWPMPFVPTAVDVARKKVAISRYCSQFPNGADDPCLLVPERIWRCTR